MKIILSGGATLGPVIPLLAVVEAYKKKYPDTEFVWVGTKKGPERQVVEEAGLRFIAIGAGKWRRYFSFLNVIDLFKICIAFLQSFSIIMRERPRLLISAGGFVSVPLHIAGWLLAVPSWVHQQDVRPGLANKLMVPFAKKITTALEVTSKRLPKKRTEWIGNPCRDLTAANPEEARQHFGIPAKACVIFALGGGTGSTTINQLILEAMPQLPRDWHVIHLSGKERPRQMADSEATVFSNYHRYDFLTEEMKDAYASADLVVARAGFSTLTELASLSKAAIIIPMYGTHQEDNVKFFAEKGGVITIPKMTTSGLQLAQMIKELMNNHDKRKKIGLTLHELLPTTAPQKIVRLIDSLVGRRF